MQKHTKNYLEHYGYVCQEEIMCERCGKPADDIHHKTPKSIWYKYNTGDFDDIENLEAVCRDCHEPEHF